VKKFLKGCLCAFLMTAFALPTGSAQAKPRRDISFLPPPRAERSAEIKEENPNLIKKVRLQWESIPNAVFYEVIVLDSDDLKNGRVILRRNSIAATGCELELRFSKSRDKLCWRVRGLDIDKNPISGFSEIRPLAQAEINTTDVKPTAKYESMKYMKAYPVFSWIPINGADGYNIQVYKDTDNNRASPDTLIESLTVSGGAEYDYYDERAYTAEGSYWWRVRAIAVGGASKSDWSEREYFTVRKGAAIAALGDSITHGGGAVSAPPSDFKYDWETYTGLDIKNLGYSGNTVEAMLARFDKDVLIDKPQVLVVFGGINNIRQGDKAEQVINGLEAIKYKCALNNIKPVFITIAPLNPAKMSLVSGLVTAPTWKGEQLKINEWIIKQRYHLDITKPLSDKRGWLKDELAADGLHPDVEGKKIIGMAIGNYIKETFDL
jgi:lysophospholipase L1-like esterase